MNPNSPALSRRILGWSLRLFVVGFTLLMALVAIDNAEEAQRIKHHSDQILDALPVAVIMCDEAGTIEFVNFEAKRLLGWSRDELVGRPLATILPDDQAQRHSEGQKRFIAKLKGRQGNWMVTQRIDGGKAFSRDGDTVDLIVRMRAISFEGHVEQIATIAAVKPPTPVPQPFTTPPVPPVATKAGKP